MKARVKLSTNNQHLFAQQQNQPTLPPFKPITRKQHQRYKSLASVSQQIKVQSSITSPTVPIPQKTERRNSLEYFGEHLKSDQQTKICEFEQTQRVSLSAWKDQLAHYRQDITLYVSKREEQFRLDNQYFRHNKMITNRFRSHLVRHLFKIYLKFELLRTTLHLAVFYMDLFFSQLPLFKNQLQGVAAAQACLFIAMKYQEIYPPQLRDWVDSRHYQLVLKFEAMILKALDYQLAHYTVQHHIKWIMWQRGDEQQDKQINLLADISLFDLNIRQIKPSELAEVIYKSSKKQPYENEKMVLNIKWMIERNPEHVHWLCQQSYNNLDCPQV